MDDDTALFCDDPMQVYLAELRKIPALDRAEEFLCVEHVRAGGEMAEAAKTRLVEANLQLVVSLAERYRNEQTHMLDLIERGNDGLLRAVQSLTTDCPSDSFADHATKFIERALADAVSSVPKA